MLDFTSALYLGLEHPMQSLGRWSRLTLGKPSALEELPQTRSVEKELAVLTGCERALLAPSTLHIFCDLFAVLAQRGAAFVVDESCYKIAHWAVERAAGLGAPVHRIACFDAVSIRQVIAQLGSRQPVFVTDGFGLPAGRFAPLRSLLRIARSYGGLVVIDDTQALGIFGSMARSGCPYGVGGGGSARRANLNDPRLILVSSLAKAFGAPVAMLAGSVKVIEEFEAQSQTRMHCSPPCAAVLQAAASALAVNRTEGDERRRLLAENVTFFQQGLRKAGVEGGPSPFPVQTLRLPTGTDPVRIQQQLSERGVATVLIKQADLGIRLTFILTACHEREQIITALGHLAESLASDRTKQKGFRQHEHTSSELPGRTLLWI